MITTLKVDTLPLNFCNHSNGFLFFFLAINSAPDFSITSVIFLKQASLAKNYTKFWSEKKTKLKEKITSGIFKIVVKATELFFEEIKRYSNPVRLS